MKINSEINKKVNDSVAECRKVLVNSTIELLKLISKDDYGVVGFDEILFLYQSKDNVSETLVVDRIEFNVDRELDFYFVNLDGEMNHSSDFLSLSNLQIVYEEVKRVVRKY